MHCELANLLSNFWLTSMILVPSSGLMVFQGVGLALVQTTKRGVSWVERRKVVRVERRCHSPVGPVAKRFKYQEDLERYIKLTYRVAFPFELRLFNTVDDAENPDRLYELFAIVVHIGK